MCEIVDPYTSSAARVACASAIKLKLENSLGDSQKIDYEEQGEVQSCRNITKVKRTNPKWQSNEWPSERVRSTQEDTVIIPSITFNSIYADQNNPSI